MRGFLKWSYLISVGVASLLVIVIASPVLTLFGRAYGQRDEPFDPELDDYDDDDSGVDVDLLP